MASLSIRSAAAACISCLIFASCHRVIASECSSDDPGDSNTRERVILSSAPRVYRLHGLLSSEECDELIALGEPRLRASEMGAASDASTRDADNPASSRDSRSMFFDSPSDAGNRLLQRLRVRWAVAADLPLSHAEPTQLARYADGEHYGLHLDASEEVPRTATLLTYLSDGFEGGETCFPRVAAEPSADSADGATAPARSGGVMRPLAKLAAAGLLARELAKGSQYCSRSRAVLRVVPQKGDGLLFFPLHPDGTLDHDTVHGGCAVHGPQGVKWIAQQWFSLEAQDL